MLHYILTAVKIFEKHNDNAAKSGIRTFDYKT